MGWTIYGSPGFPMFNMVLAYCRNIETVQKQVCHFTVENSSSQCSTDNHVDRSGARMICDRRINLRCISAWFGSTEHFETVVRTGWPTKPGYYAMARSQG